MRNKPLGKREEQWERDALRQPTSDEGRQPTSRLWRQILCSLKDPTSQHYHTGKVMPTKVLVGTGCCDSKMFVGELKVRKSRKIKKAQAHINSNCKTLRCVLFVQF